ncbi:protein kinase [Trypanosoma theileri]|uniref:non-specific serine/threonine protein kinase n=1 Tax=Trypanosoma theileri TaxID=67003 RepID=A0A1X0NYB7_9TRYP|nr:protein kinase [Trypanosoma theileri]ORC89667.1 protein kinase [Trypanosoma theileri]
MQGVQLPALTSVNSSRSVSENNAHTATPGCGELTVVPMQSELQVAQRPDTYSPPSRRSQFGPLAVSDVCPTCHRPLRENNMKEPQPPPTKERFTPQYFRALIQNHGKQLTICDSPSSHNLSMQQQQQQQQSMDPSARRPSRRKTRLDPLSDEKQEESIDRSNEEDMTRDDATTGGIGTSGSGDINGYYKRYFREIQKLGNGTFGGVYLCQHVMEGVELGYFALKKIPVGDNTEYLQNVLREVRILEEVKRHPNVVEYNHSWVDIAQTADFGPPVRCLFILMEYATLGSLDSYLERYGKALPTIAVWYFFLSALAGTAHLHQKNILHRDLKPQNLLLTGPIEKPPRVLVSDFGTATLLGELSYERTGGTGTMEYMAPELFECAPGTDGTYIHMHTKATDVWSLGMILHYLACDGTLPESLPNGEVVLKIEERAPYTRPPEMVELIRAMLHRDPEKRPTCKDLLASTVVKTILRSFDKANLSSDILPTASEATTTTTTAVSTNSHRSNVGTKRSFQVDWVPRSSPTMQSRKASQANEEDLAYPHSPVVEVPLMLQYKTQETRRIGSAGARGANKVRKVTTVERAVQTDDVKIVYE